jgi:hypothetical protein
MSDRSIASRPRLPLVEGRPGAETTLGETAKRRVNDSLLGPDSWATDLLAASGWGGGLLERDDWERLPDFHRKKQTTRPRLVLVD